MSVTDPVDLYYYNCVICDNRTDFETTIVLHCNHTFHISCIIHNLFENKCNECSSNITIDELVYLYSKYIVNVKYKYSNTCITTKLKNLNQELDELVKSIEKLKIEKKKSKDKIMRLIDIIT